MNEKTISEQNRKDKFNETLRAQGRKCFICGGKLRRSITRDHLVPLAYGGTKGWDNIVLVHEKCNRRKANNMPTTSQIYRYRETFKNEHPDIKLWWAWKAYKNRKIK